MSRSISIARTLILLIALAATGIGMICAAAFLYIGPQLPAVDTLRDVQLQTPLRIYSRDGKLIGEFGEKRRSPISIQEVPQTVINAFLAAEDDHFYQHRGVDISGLLRAAAQLLTSGDIQSGGSTITMQVAKNYFLSRERTFTRKFTEIFLAIEIERSLSKGDILELYLNKIFLGNHAYGIEAAAQIYYGKSVKTLNIAQIAMIAGLPKAPSAYNPIANPSRAKIRRNWILGRMRALSFITENEYQDALKTPISARAYGTKLDVDAAYVAEMVRLNMLKRYGRAAYEDGYTVITTVDSRLQASAQRAVLDGVTEYDDRHGYRGAEQRWSLPAALDDAALITFSERLNAIGRVGPWEPALILRVEENSATALLANGQQTTLDWEHSLAGTAAYINEDRQTFARETAAELIAAGDVVRLRARQEPTPHWRLSQLPDIQAALVSLDADNGAILSLVGGYDYQMSSYNRVTQAARQPGSNFKPFIYTAALDNGFTPASVINDAPLVFDDPELGGTWRPSNDSGTFRGPMRLRKALYLSRNLVSIRLLKQLGIKRAIDYVERFGFSGEQLPRDLSLALGSHSLPPLDIVTGYAVFANGGFKVEPWLVDRIIGRDGSTVFQANPAIVCRECEVADASIGYALDNLEAESLDEMVNAPDEAITVNKAPRVVSEQVIFLIDDMLKDVVRRGTGRKALVLERGDAAGKTGTTNGPTDAWFSGYSGGVVTSTWAGFDQNRKLGRNEYGGSVALPIWINYMRDATANRPERLLSQPIGIETVRIDPDTGRLARPGQANAIFEFFRSDDVPSGSGAGEVFDEAGENPYEIF